jgi:hypothetical protein
MVKKLIWNNPPPTRTSSDIVSNVGVFYKFLLNIKIDKDWKKIEIESY